MKKKNLWLLILGLGLTSGTILINRFVISIPNWLAIAFSIIAICALVAFLITNKK
nr:hypothetical protein [uncultured Niameybacter sp.]